MCKSPTNGCLILGGRDYLFIMYIYMCVCVSPICCVISLALCTAWLRTHPYPRCQPQRPHHAEWQPHGKTNIPWLGCPCRKMPMSENEMNMRDVSLHLRPKFFRSYFYQLFFILVHPLSLINGNFRILKWRYCTR